MPIQNLVIGTGADHVYMATFDTESGKLAITDKLETGKGPTWVLVEPSTSASSSHQACPRRFFAVNEFEDKIQVFAQSDSSSSPSSWKLEAEFPSLGSTPCHLSFGPNQDTRTLVCANYFENFSIFHRNEKFSENKGSAHHFKDASWLISKKNDDDEDDVVKRYQNEIGPQKDRQEMSHPHMVTFSPHHPELFLVPDLGTDSILQAHHRTGKIISRVKCSKPGSGPRHLVFHPVLKNRFYVVNELSSSISVYDIATKNNNNNNNIEDEGTKIINENIFSLTELETVSCLPPGKSSFDYGGSLFFNNNQGEGENTTFGVEQNTCASINFLPSSIGPAGKFLFVSCRGRDAIVGFELDVENGSIVRRIGEFKTSGRIPRFFCFSHDGKFVLICNQESDSIAVFKVVVDSDDQVKIDDSGEPVCFVSGVKSPQCIGFF